MDVWSNRVKRFVRILDKIDAVIINFSSTLSKHIPVENKEETKYVENFIHHFINGLLTLFVVLSASFIATQLI